MFGRSDQTVVTTFAADDKMSPVVRNIRRSMGDFKKDAIQGFGLGAGLSVFNAARMAIGGVADFLMDAARAAAEDEASTKRLTTALRDNVDAWDGSTEALDTAIERAQALAFTDDEVRDGIGKLIPLTRDLEEAIRIQNVAMDIARGRNVDLASATDIVRKAWMGQYGALRRLGIQIDKTATKEEALGELQKTYAGQAAEFAETASGSFLTVQIALDEIVEQLGYQLLPYLKEFAKFLREEAIPNIDSWADSLAKAANLLGILGAIAGADIPSIIRHIQELTDSVEGARRTLDVPADGPRFTDPFVDAAEDGARGVRDAMEKLPRYVAVAVVDMRETIKSGKKGIIEQFRDLAWQSKHPFAEVNYAEWLRRKLETATRRMRVAEREGKPSVVAQYRTLRESIVAEIGA